MSHNNFRTYSYLSTEHFMNIVLAQCEYDLILCRLKPDLVGDYEQSIKSRPSCAAFEFPDVDSQTVTNYMLLLKILTACSINHNLAVGK